jgi:hypothetical protein
VSAGRLDDLSEIYPGKNRHEIIARLLCERTAAEQSKLHGTEDAGKEWRAPFVSGGLENGDFVHVFTN